MRVPYLYEDSPILRNKLSIRDQILLDNAEVNYAVLPFEGFGVKSVE